MRWKPSDKTHPEVCQQSSGGSASVSHRRRNERHGVTAVKGDGELAVDRVIAQRVRELQRESPDIVLVEEVRQETGELPKPRLAAETSSRLMAALLEVRNEHQSLCGFPVERRLIDSLHPHGDGVDRETADSRRDADVSSLVLGLELTLSGIALSVEER